MDAAEAVLGDAPVVGVELGDEPFEQLLQRIAELPEGLQRAPFHDADELAVGSRRGRNRLLHRKPAVETMASWVHAEQTLDESPHRPMLAVLQALEIAPHVS